MTRGSTSCRRPSGDASTLSSCPCRTARMMRSASSRPIADLSSSLELPKVPTAEEEIRRVVTVFRELRSGVTTTVAPSSNRHPGRFPQPRRSRSSPVASRCRHISATVDSGRPMSLLASLVRWSKTRLPIGWRGANTSRWLRATGRAGRSSIQLAVTSRDDDAVTAPDGRASPRSCRRSFSRDRCR